MKTILKIASVLTWFNLVFWGALLAFGVLICLVSMQLPLLASAVLMSAIPLNCFAALKLHTSIRHPNIPLSHQTPVGIRFVGFMALFFGITFIYSGVSFLADPKPAAEAFQQALSQMPISQTHMVPGLGMAYLVRLVAVVWLVLGFLVSVNVILNLRLLRWYYLQIRR
jgi:hypothetical protein